VTAAPEVTEQETQEWYRPGKSIQDFHNSRAFVRVLVGGRGSGKTSGITVDVIRHCWQNAGAKAMLLRKTEASQTDSTIETMLICFEQMGPLYKDTGDSLFKIWNGGRTIRMPSLKAVEAFNEALPTWKTKSDRMRWLANEGTRLCSFIECRGLPHINISQSKLRGFECSMMVFIEADQIDEASYNLSLACLRWKGSDPDTCDDKGFIIDKGAILDTNPPSPSHWIAKLEEEEMKKPEAESTMEFWHISTYENEHNLPPGYIENSIILPYRKNPAMIDRMLWGRYADAFDGNAVYYAFDPQNHVGENLPWPKGAYLVRGWDFGTRNSVVWSAYWVEDGCEYWHVLAEQYLESSDTERQCREALKLTDLEFPFWNNRDICAGVLDFCDPAGRNSSYLVSDARMRDPIAVLKTFGIYPGYKTAINQRGLQVSISLVNRLMEKRDAKGHFVFRVDRKNCHRLYRGFAGGYRYPKVGEANYGKDEPLKGILCDNLDHLQDGFRYSAINCLRLLWAEFTKKNPPNFAAHRVNPNPNRQI
jgi:hypothetical protein